MINRLLATGVVAATLLFPPPSEAIDGAPWLWASFCGHLGTGSAAQLVTYRPLVSDVTVPCGPAPTAYHRLQDATGTGDVAVDLSIGSAPSARRLCFAANGVPEAPVIRIQRGHALKIRLINTLRDDNADNTQNCLLQTFVAGGACDQPTIAGRASPGDDGGFYPIEPNQPHPADGTMNLHVHGLVVSPRPCHDEVVRSTLYPANWGGAIDHLMPCQAAPNELHYTYDIPPDHPEGLYWYHAHRHGQSEAATMLGLVGAIVIEGPDDVRRAAMGVSDDIMIVSDKPVPEEEDEGGNAVPRPTSTHRRALNHLRHHSVATPAADPRIDIANEVACEADDPDTGGPEATHLTLNGAAVPEKQDGSMPSDDVVLTKTMRPGQVEIWRILNASADTALRPRMIVVQNGVATRLPLKVLARDGVPVADDAGYPFLETIDTERRPVLLDPANRLEILVHAPPPGATLYLDTAQVRPGCAGDGIPARRLLRIVSAGDPVAGPAISDAQLTPADPDMYYNHILDQTPSVRRVLAFSEYPHGFTVTHANWDGAAPQQGQYDPDATDFYLTQLAASDQPDLQPVIKPFDMHSRRPDVLVHLHGKDSVTEDWTIQNYSLEFHAFHIHQVHFRDVTADAGDPSNAPLLDTVNVPPAVNQSGAPGTPGETRIRLTFTRAQIGTFVFHCHVLEHEDAGMMQTIRVVAD